MAKFGDLATVTARSTVELRAESLLAPPNAVHFFIINSFILSRAGADLTKYRFLCKSHFSFSRRRFGIAEPRVTPNAKFNRVVISGRWRAAA